MIFKNWGVVSGAFPCRPSLLVRPKIGIEGTIPIESSIAFTYNSFRF